MERSNLNCWRATLTPHRSLSRQGFVAVMAAIIAVNLAGGIVFAAIGAWPVTGFMGLDVALVWWAFRANFAAARQAERIEITEHELVVEHLAEGRACREHRFVRRWVRVELEEEHDRELIGGLFLASRGIRTEIGRFLAPAERLELARELKSALARPHI
jgi:uncharacterized membrane protein